MDADAAQRRCYTDALAVFRTLYASEVVETVRTQNVVVTHDYDEGENKGKAIPLPATLSMLIGNRMAGKKRADKRRSTVAIHFRRGKNNGESGTSLPKMPGTP